MDIRLPRLGEGADSGTVAAIFVKEGDIVKKDQAILELESEKAVASIPSPSAGRITRVHVKEGDEIKVGAMIASLQEEGAAASPVIDATVGDESDDGAPPPAFHSAAPAVPVSAPVQSTAAGVEEFPVIHPAGTTPPASPSIRKMAKQLGIDLSRVRGSERGGRIVLADVKSHIARLQQIASQPPAPSGAIARPPQPSIDFSQWGKTSSKKMTPLRKAIAGKMAESWSTVPRVTQFDEADVTDLLALQKKYGAKYEKKGARLTVTSLALKALASTLKNHPLLNSSLDLAAGEIILKEYVHLGIAVDTPGGLIVPVLRSVDKKSVLEVSVELKSLAERTRDRKVGLDEMQGASFTVSNQGGIGSGHFTPVVNTPEVAILGMGRGAVKPVVREGKIVQRTMLPLALSYDHRVIDGADAARFMVDLVKSIEQFKESDVKI